MTCELIPTVTNNEGFEMTNKLSDLRFLRLHRQPDRPLAVQRGLRPILAGRDPQRLAQQAAELGLEHVAFSLDDRPPSTGRCSQRPSCCTAPGRSVHTSRPMADACLRTGVHYLDITGEIAVFEALARRDAEAQAAGVMLLPGAGSTSCRATAWQRISNDGCPRPPG